MINPHPQLIKKLIDIFWSHQYKEDGRAAQHAYLRDPLGIGGLRGTPVFSKAERKLLIQMAKQKDDKLQ